MVASRGKMRPIHTQSLSQPSGASDSPGSATSRRSEEAVTASQQGFQPPQIRSVADTGLSLGFLSDLVLKMMYFEGVISGFKIAEMIKLPFAGVVEEALEFLRREHLCEVRGAGGLGESSYQYTITDRGGSRARELMERSKYVGPAPVTVDVYAESVRQQPLQKIIIYPPAMRQHPPE